jgi:hypothetical protein
MLVDPIVDTVTVGADIEYVVADNEDDQLPELDGATGMTRK